MRNSARQNLKSLNRVVELLIKPTNIMKNKKLNLNELKVKSFVTQFVNGDENTAKGGSGRPCPLTVEIGCTIPPICPSAEPH